MTTDGAKRAAEKILQRRLTFDNDIGSIAAIIYDDAVEELYRALKDWRLSRQWKDDEIPYYVDQAIRNAEKGGGDG